MTEIFQKGTSNNCVYFFRWKLLKHSQCEPKDAGQKTPSEHHPDNSKEGAKTASASPSSIACATHNEIQCCLWTIVYFT